MSRPLVPRPERLLAVVVVLLALFLVDDPDDLFLLAIAATPFLALGLAYLLAVAFDR